MAYKIHQAKKALMGLVLNRYVNIALPDTYDKPVYKFDSTITGATAEALADKIDKTLASSAAEMGAKPSPKRPYERNDDGSITFKFKIKQFAEGERPFKVWDMKMNPITDVPNVTGGTVINLNFAFYVSEFRGKAFIGLQPTHVQIKEAKVYEGGSADPTFGAGDGFEDGESGAAAPSFSGESEPESDADDGGNGHDF